MSDRAPCVWCNTLTIGRNQDGEPLCGDYDCQKDDHSQRLRKETHDRTES